MAYGTIQVGVMPAPVKWPETTQADWGAWIGETGTAFNSGVLVTGVNDLSFDTGASTTAWWAESPDGLLVAGPITFLTGPYPHSSDPGALYWPIDQRFHRFAVSFFENTNSDFESAVVTQASVDGYDWFPSTPVVTVDGGRGVVFTDHPRPGMGTAFLYVERNDFPNLGARNGRPRFQVSPDGVSWSASMEVLSDAQFDTLYWEPHSITVTSFVQQDATFPEGGEWVFVPWARDDGAGHQTIELQACSYDGTCVPLPAASTPTFLIYNPAGLQAALPWAPDWMRCNSQPAIVGSAQALSLSEERLLLYWMEYDAGVGKATIYTRFSSDDGRTWGPKTAVDDPQLKQNGIWGDQFLADANFSPNNSLALCLYQQEWSSTTPGWWTVARRCYNGSDDGSVWTERPARQPDLYEPQPSNGGGYNFLGDQNSVLGVATDDPAMTRWIDVAGYVGPVTGPDGIVRQMPMVQHSEWYEGCAITEPASAKPAWLPGLGLLAIALARENWRRKGRRLLAVGFAIVATVALLAAGAEAQERLAGDCNGDGRVTVNEVITLVNIDLQGADPSTCDACSALPPVIISCVTRAVYSLLYLSPPAPTPTPPGGP